MPLMCPKVIYLAILSSFEPLWPTQKPHILAKKYTQGLIFSQGLHKFIVPVNVVISYFCDAKMYKNCPKVIISVNFDQFSDLFLTLRPPTAQKKYFMGPESLNSLHKLMLPENVFTSDFCGIKMYEKWPIFIILVNFDQFSDLYAHYGPSMISKKYM